MMGRYAMLKYFLFYCFFVWVISVIPQTASENRKFFSLLRQLDSMNRNKRRSAYLGLNKFLFKYPQEKYLNILQQRTKRVYMEQRYLLTNLIKRFSQIKKEHRWLKDNIFLKQCQHAQVAAVDYISGIRSYYNISIPPRPPINFSRWNRNISLKSWSNRQRQWERVEALLYYLGLLGYKRKNKSFLPKFDFLGYLPVQANRFVGQRRARMGRIRLLFKNFNLLTHYYEDIYLLNSFLAAKNSNTTKNTANILIYNYCLHSNSIGGQFISKPSCKDFLILFRHYILADTKQELKNVYETIIKKIKEKIAGNSLIYLLNLEQNLDALFKYKVLQNKNEWLSLLRKKIVVKLKKIKKACEQQNHLFTSSYQAENNITKYIKKVPTYYDLIKTISPSCLFLKTFFISNPQILTTLGKELDLPIRARNRGLGRWSELPNESYTKKEICKDEFLNNLLCINPLYTLKFLIECNKKALTKKLLNKIESFEEFSKQCKKVPEEYISYYAPSSKEERWVSTSTFYNYWSAIKLLGLKNTESFIPNFLNFTLENVAAQTQTRLTQSLISAIEVLPLLSEEDRKVIIANVIPPLLAGYYIYHRRYDYPLLTLEDIISIISFLSRQLTLEFNSEKSYEYLQTVFNSEFTRKTLLQILLHNTFSSSVPSKWRALWRKKIKALTGQQLHTFVFLLHRISSVITPLLRENERERRVQKDVPNVSIQINPQLRANIKVDVKVLRSYNTFSSQTKREQKVITTLALLALVDTPQTLAKISQYLAKYINRLSNNQFEIIKTKLLLYLFQKSNILPSYEVILTRQKFHISQFYTQFNLIHKIIADVYRILKNSKYYSKEMQKLLRFLWNNKCSYFQMESEQLFPHLVEFIENIDESYKYKIIHHFPMILSNYTMPLKLSENLYFTHLDLLFTNPDVNQSICNQNNCFATYNIRFLKNTSKKVRKIYKKILSADSVIFNRAIFYFPAIINTKTKQIIISDYSLINKEVVKMLKRSVR
jgi:hypothetical protein